MTERVAAAGYGGKDERGATLHKLSKNHEKRATWSKKMVRNISNRTGQSGQLVLCSLYFMKDNFQTCVKSSRQIGIASKNECSRMSNPTLPRGTSRGSSVWKYVLKAGMIHCAAGRPKLQWLPVFINAIVHAELISACSYFHFTLLLH